MIKFQCICIRGIPFRIQSVGSMINILHPSKGREKNVLKENYIQDQKLEYNNNLMIFKLKSITV